MQIVQWKDINGGQTQLNGNICQIQFVVIYDFFAGYSNWANTANIDCAGY